MRINFTYIYIIIILFLFLYQYEAKGTQVGPDKFGYICKDSREAGGPVYKWYEIPANTDRIISGLGDDNVKGPFSIGGSFTYYWYKVDKFWVGSNGYIAFNNIHIAAPFPNLPDSTDSKHNFLAALLTDLSFAEKGNPGKCLYAINKDSLIISYIDVPFWDQYSKYTGKNTFQIILNKVDKSITFNYQKQVGSSQSGIVIGIENISGSIGLQYPSVSYPATPYSIKFYYPENPSNLVITDAAINWNTKFESKGFFIPFPSKSLTLETDIINYGNQQIPSLSLEGRVIDPLGKTVFNETIKINNPLKIAIDTNIKYSQSFSPVISGTHSFISNLSGINNDKYTSNDTIKQEIVAVDTSQSIISLNYARNLNEYGGQSWQGGDGGVGVYYIPPVYPVKIVSTNFVIVSNDQNTSFFAKIYDDKGPNGTPGKLLDSVFVTSNMIELKHKTTVPVRNNVVIYSGGVYVSWVMNGEFIQIGVDKTPPFSFQSFENLSNTWSQFREYQSTDFFIGLDIKKHGIEDIGVSSIEKPIPNTIIKEPTKVSCWIKNFGKIDISNFDAYYSMDYGKSITESYKGQVLKAGDSTLFTFTTPLWINKDSLKGYLCVGVKMENDFLLSNDTVCKYVEIFNTKGINEISNDKNIIISPNPFKENTTIMFNKTGVDAFDLYLSNAFGQVIRRYYNTKSKNLVIGRENLISGIYFIEIRCKESKYYDKLIIN